MAQRGEMPLARLPRRTVDAPSDLARAVEHARILRGAGTRPAPPASSTGPSTPRASGPGPSRSGSASVRSSCGRTSPSSCTTTPQPPGSSPAPSRCPWWRTRSRPWTTTCTWPRSFASASTPTDATLPPSVAAGCQNLVSLEAHQVLTGSRSPGQSRLRSREPSGLRQHPPVHRQEPVNVAARGTDGIDLGVRRSCAPVRIPVATSRGHAGTGRTTFESRTQMADLAYILLTVVFFTAVGLVARRHGSSGAHVMTVLDWVGLGAVVVLLGYLFVALLRSDKVR
ncbi:hypothetical protein NKG05_03440 [Oerskovia sp. M15]